jgi:hypothetical protein
MTYVVAAYAIVVVTLGVYGWLRLRERSSLRKSLSRERK